MSKVKSISLKKSKKLSNPKSRKEIRKAGRKLKKQKKQEYYTNRKKVDKDKKNKPILNENVSENLKQQIKQKPIQYDKFKEIQKDRLKQDKLKKEMSKQRNRQLQDANIEEDRNIKRLEKQLKLNKRKTKAIPKSFVSEGLDYLLEICDGDMKNAVSAEQQFKEANDDFEEDFELMTGKKIKKQKVKEDDFDNFSDLEGDLQDSEDDLNDLEDSEDDLKDSEDDLDDLEDSKNNLQDSKDDLEDKNLDDFNDNEEIGTWEDIYGRLRSKDGSILNNEPIKSSKYIPPALRKQDSQNERLARLTKQLKGLLNRLAEANMHSISNQIEELYMANSRNDMNETMTNLIVNSLATHVFTPERLLLEHVMLISILHANVGTEVGAHFLQEIVKLFDDLFKKPQEVEDKTLDNVVVIIAQLYNFKVFDAGLVYDILKKFSERFNEKSIECILLILKNVGFSLRKDDPLALKSLILDLQKEAAKLMDENKENPRIKFMLDILLAIKNNNVSKIPNYDSTYSEHLKKILKGFIRKGNYITQLKISLDDLLKAESRGKWWIVGSAWTGNIDTNKDIKPINKSDEKLLNLARKHHMNTDTRRNIFCIIMSAEDYLDAFEKLLKLGLKNQQEREIIHVILHCCLQEKNYNPYYSVLAQKFCDYDRKFQMTIKFSVWDKLKALNECSATQLSNLAKMLTHLFLEKGIPISTLKIVEFCELDKTTLRFLRQVLLGIFLHDDVDACVQVFEKVSQSEKLKMFRESLRLFIHHFLLKNLDNNVVGEEHKKLLRERTGLIEKMLINEKKNKL